MGKRATIEQHRRWGALGAWEPEAIKSWRAYADPINQALIEKWKDGEPLERNLPAKKKSFTSRHKALGATGHWKDL